MSVLTEREFYDRLAEFFDVMTDWHSRLAVELPFIETILGRTAPTATGEEGLIVIELLDAIYKSARTGRPVRLRSLSQ